MLINNFPVYHIFFGLLIYPLYIISLLTLSIKYVNLGEFSVLTTHIDEKGNTIEIPSNSLQENPLDNCYHVYLDVGTNVGIQIRKLFEPTKYPNALVHSIFESHFGSIDNRNSPKGGENKVCAIGFEPNFNYNSRLTELEKKYNECGWKLKIFKETAVSDHNGRTSFYFSR